MPSDQPEIPSILAAQRRHFAEGETRDVTSRLEALDRLRRTLEEREEQLLEALAADLGKPAVEGFLAEYHFLLQELRLVQRSLRRWLKPRRAKSPLYFWPCRSRVHLEPRGVTLVMAPWNYPVQLSVAPLIASLAAGNTVVLKPSELAPASAEFLSSLLADCFPPELVAVVTGDADTSAELLKERFDHVFFTGSEKVGRLVARAAAEHLTPHVLELGGKCPCVVHSSADLAVTARRILAAKLFNAGQTCFAPDFVLVHDDTWEALVRELKGALDQFPWEQELATIINRHHYERLQGLLEGPVHAKGADDPGRLHFAPRLLPEAGWDSAAMEEEIFGPILPVLAYRDEEEMRATLRDRPSPLALYCFSREDEFTEALLNAIPSGSVGINDCGKQASNLDLPFGGVGASGHGRYRGRHGVETFSYQRPVTRRWFLPDPFELLPPREKMGRFLRKWMR